MKKVLIFDSGSSLHTSAYANAIRHSLTSHTFKFNEQTSSINNKILLYFHVYRLLIKFKPDILFIVTADKFAKWYFIFWLPLILFRKVPCLGFYFSFHNLYQYSPKSFALHCLLATGLFNRVIISDPLYHAGKRLPIFQESKVRFAPDFWDPADSINQIYTKQQSREILGLDCSSFIVCLAGAVTEKKYVSLLVEICKLFYKPIQKNNIIFILAGSFSPESKEILHNAFGNASQLPSFLLVRDEFIAGNILPHYLNASNLVWCIQKDFMNSSGIFTRACANGTPSIVNPASTLSSLSSIYNLSVVPDSISPQSVYYAILEYKKTEHLGILSSNCLEYSLSTSLDNFSNYINQVTAEFL